MKITKHLLLLLSLAIIVSLYPATQTAEAGAITCKSTAGVAADTLAVLNYVAQNVDHDVCVTSAYRSPSYNASVGGASASQHTKGKAIDLSLRGLTDNQRVKLVHTILSHPNVKGFGYYTNSQSLHFDTRPVRTGKGYWGYNYSSSGFDADARAGRIHSIIVGMVYRWSSTGSPGEMGTGNNESRLPPAITAPTAPVGDCPNFNVALDPNSAEALGLLGSTDTNTQSCAMQRVGTWQAQNPNQVTTQPTDGTYTQTSPQIPNVLPPSLTRGLTGSLPNNPATQIINGVINAFPQYPLGGAQPQALSPNVTPTNQPTQPNTTTPTPTISQPSSVQQCNASSTPTTAKKIPEMTPSEWDRAVRILYAESGSCKLGKNDTNCIKVAETFRNRLIYSMETGKNSCWSTWDRILRFTNVGSCGYFQANPGVKNAQSLKSDSETYKKVAEALFQAVYGGTNLSLGNLHNFTTGYHSNIVDQSSVVPAGGNYTYVKSIPREQRVNIAPYHFPNCAVEQKLPATSGNQTTAPTQPPATAAPTQPQKTTQNPFLPQTQSNISPVTQNQQQRNPGLQGAGQGFYNSAVSPSQNYGSFGNTSIPYTTSLQQAVQNQQQYVAALNQLRQQQQELLRLEVEEPQRQVEIRKQLIELQKQQDELLRLQLLALQQQQQAAQRKPSGNRTVTIIAAPTLDYSGVILTSLAGKLQAEGHDIIMMPDAANYQLQLDKTLTAIKALPEGVAINCVGWNKGALGCIAFSKQIEGIGRKLNNLVLIDPSEGIDGSAVPGVAASDFATDKITLTINGSSILYLPEAGSSLFAFESADAQAAQVDEVYKTSSTLDQFSLGLDPTLQNQIVSRLMNDSSGTGNIYNVDLGPGNSATQRIVGLQGLLQMFRRSLQENSPVSPIVLLHWLGNGIGSLFATAQDELNLAVSAEDLNQDLYLLLVQELLFGNTDESVDDATSDITISALKATQTLSGQYRFFGSIKRKYSDDAAEIQRDIDSYFDASVTNELLIDLTCDGSIDEGVMFITPSNLVLPTPDGAEVTVSEYLPIEEDGLHCFMFVADADDVVSETNEDNNSSQWREFVAGFGSVTDTPTEDLPELNFAISVYSSDGQQLIQDWTNEDISIAAGQQIVFRWDAPEYDVCSPLLSSLSTNILDNTSTGDRNTLTEKIDLEERTGYYELRCEVNGDTKVEYLHVTVE